MAKPYRFVNAMPAQRRGRPGGEQAGRLEESSVNQDDEPRGLAGKFMNVAGRLFSTADTAGRRAALTFASTADGQPIPPRSCSELSSALTAFVGDKALSCESQAEGVWVVTVAEGGLLKKTCQIYFAPVLSTSLLASLSPKRCALVVLEWPADVLEVDDGLCIFVWNQAVRLGPRRGAGDYVSMWLRSELGFVFASRELIERPPEKTAKGLFTGREPELGTLAQLLAEERRWICSLTAYSGTGKSYFLRRFMKLYGARMLPALVDHNSVEVGGAAVAGLTSLIHNLALQLSRGGCSMSKFDKVWGQYSKVTVVEGESRLSLYLKKSIQATSSLNPVIGLAQAGMKIYDTWSEELKQESESLASNTWVRRLTEALVEDLQPFVERQRGQYLLWRRPVLIFDTYEWLCMVIDTWLRTCLLANSSFQALSPLIVLAGRHELLRIDTRWSEYQEAVCPVRLEPLSAGESRSYLEGLGVPAAKIEDYLELTGGLPLFLSLVASSQSVEAAVKALAQRILEEVEPAWRERFLEASVLDGFNRDSLAAVLGDADIFERLTRATFVEAREGRWHFAEQVRKVLLRTLEMESPERARQLHERMRWP